MDYYPIPTALTSGGEWAARPVRARGNWHMLMSVCAAQENGGIIVGARGWTERKWVFTLGLDPGAVNECLQELEAEGLVLWEGDNLRVAYYDPEQEVRARKRSVSASAAARKMWAAVKERNGERMPDACATHANEDESHARRGEERRGEEGEEKEDPAAGAASPPPSSPKRDPSQEMALFIDWWNRIIGGTYRGSKALQAQIETLLAEGHTQKQMRGVALLLRDDWADDAKMATNVRPTVALNPEKFSARLDEARQRRNLDDGSTPAPATPPVPRTNGKGLSAEQIAVMAMNWNETEGDVTTLRRRSDIQRRAANGEQVTDDERRWLEATDPRAGKVPTVAPAPPILTTPLRTLDRATAPKPIVVVEEKAPAHEPSPEAVEAADRLRRARAAAGIA